MDGLPSNTATPHLHIAFLVWWWCGGWWQRRRRGRWLLTTSKQQLHIPASLSINSPTNLVNPADSCAFSIPCTPMDPLSLSLSQCRKPKDSHKKTCNIATQPRETPGFFLQQNQSLTLGSLTEDSVVRGCEVFLKMEISTKTSNFG